MSGRCVLMSKRMENMLDARWPPAPPVADFMQCMKEVNNADKEVQCNYEVMFLSKYRKKEVKMGQK